MASGNSAITAAVQIGVEVTPGTIVAANKQLLSVCFKPDIKNEGRIFRPCGFKYPTLHTPLKEWMEATIEGDMSYTELPYLLSGLVSYAAPTGPTDVVAYTWGHKTLPAGADTVKTFSIENGNASRAQKYAYGQITGLDFEWSRKGCTIGGNLIANKVTDNIVLTAAPTQLSMIPIKPGETIVKLATTQGGLAGAAALVDVAKVGVSLKDKFGPSWVLNASDDFKDIVELEPKATGNIRAQVNTEGMQWLPYMRSGDTFYMRVESTGGLIAGSVGTNYKMTTDVCCKLTKAAGFSDEDGLRVIDWEFGLFYDAAWANGPIQFTIVNKLAAL